MAKLKQDGTEAYGFPEFGLAQHILRKPRCRKAKGCSWWFLLLRMPITYPSCWSSTFWVTELDPVYCLIVFPALYQIHILVSQLLRKYCLMIYTHWLQCLKHDSTFSWFRCHLPAYYTINQQSIHSDLWDHKFSMVMLLIKNIMYR